MLLRRWSDPDAPRGTYVHWVVVGLDPASTELAEGAVPAGARQVRNSAGKAAYSGPCLRADRLTTTGPVIPDPGATNHPTGPPADKVPT